VFLSKGLLFNQKLIKTSRREAPDAARSAAGEPAKPANRVSKKSFWWF
jgi:hypothetical protein